MKADYLLSSLCLAPLALAAPLSHTVTLVAGKSVWRPGHQVATFVEEVQHVLVNKQLSRTTPKERTAPSIILDAERPMTTAELMQLSKEAAQTHPTTTPPPQKIKSPKAKSAKDGSSSKKISVGALVVPSSTSSSRIGVLAKIFDPQTSPYLIPGQYVASQRADVLIVGLILACVMVVVAMEGWELICNLVTRGISSRREGPIRLVDADGSAKDIEKGGNEEDDEDDCDAPFGGFRKLPIEEKGLRLPEKVDEKAAWI